MILNESIFNLTVDEAQNLGYEIPTLNEIFLNVCAQMDSTIYKAIMLIFISWTFRTVVLSHSREYWQTTTNPLFLRIKDLVLWVIERLDSLLETLGLGSALYLLYFAWVQGLIGFWGYFWIAIIILFAFPIGIIKIIKSIKKIFKKKND